MKKVFKVFGITTGIAAIAAVIYKVTRKDKLEYVTNDPEPATEKEAE